MNIYIYTQSGHNFGLDNVRRGSVIYNILKDCDPILCTADYRAATFARELGVYKGIGIDVIGNLPNLMERGDMLIFDSNEPSDTMKSFMADYCTHLYEVGVDIPKTIVDDKFFESGNQSIQKCFFLADDDYNNELLKLCENQEKQDMKLLMGHYFFLGNENKLAHYFEEIIEEEEYFDTISNTKYLLTSSLNAAFESLASGNHPVFYKRKDKELDLDLINEYNIPVIDGDNLKEVVQKFEDTISKYPETKKLEKVNIDKIKDEITAVIEKFKAISKSLEANY